MPEPLLVVDVQKGFLNDFTKHIPERVAQLIEEQKYEPVMFTRFVNVPGSPYQRFLDWHDCEKPPETDIAPELETHAEKGKVFAKEGFTGLPPKLRGFIKKRGFAKVNVVGIDTDMCVLKIAMDVFDMGVQPVVLIDGCASTQGAQAHLAGLAILSRNIGPQQLHDTGLSRGTVAAPE